MLSSILSIPIFLGASAIAQSSPAVLCVAGQCLQGLSNTTIGVTLSAPGAPTSLQLLPGQYSATTNPQLLHNLLTSSSASISPSAGFDNATLSSLPLNVALQPGLAIYADRLYSGQAAFSSLPSSHPVANSSTPLSGGSMVMSSNVWVAVSAGQNSRVILWDAVPDFAQLPSSSSSQLALLDIQSSACSPPCAGSGVCSAAGTCTCPTGFNGTSCESCAEGFFGPTCQPCPAGCATCDQGISGSGRCLNPIIANAPSTCNCLNGECSSSGTCSCNPGWTTASNGTACATCAPGFFLTASGDCSICQLGCNSCADVTGNCLSCKTGFSQDADDATKCIPPQTKTSNGEVCPDGSFGGGGPTCSICSPSCATCTGGTSNDCIQCASGSFSFNGGCVSANQNGVCEGSTLFGDNIRHSCNACPAKCTSCGIPSFSTVSTPNNVQCTGCVPGSVLSNGKCLDSCPSGTFLSPQDNLTCTACDSSCGTCAGSSTFCLTCPNNQFAANGKCVATCPSNTFTSGSSCLPCHPDCASCSGPSFNQCSSCSASLPVLSSGRCLPTCTKTQFFDRTSSSCQACDPSCSSCSGSGPSNCLACASSSQVLRSGTCTAANCNNSSSIIPGLGACLSDLVVTVQASGTSAAPPLPSITGIDTPTPATATPTRRSLEWWEILLMALGCAFIFVAVLWLWRRHARKQRAKRTAKFAAARDLDHKGWRFRLLRLGGRLFGHKAPRAEGEAVTLVKLRAAEEARHDRDVEKIIHAYTYPRHEPAPSFHEPPRHAQDRMSASAGSLYSQVTGMPRQAPEPRQPVRTNGASRFSASTLGGSLESRPEALPAMPRMTDAEAYAMAVRPTLTGASRNPFRL